jgi:putative hydrolase of the HAD superfamily
MTLQGPEWVFLDLDNTLWDFDGNAEEALTVLFHRHHLHIRSGYDVHRFVALYKRINETYWKRYEKGEIDKDFLRTARFTQTFKEMGIPDNEHPENAWDEYLEICPGLKRLVPGAMELLGFLSRNARIGIITNGFERTQEGKIKGTGMDKYVVFVVNSESVGAAKPQVRIFDEALRKADILPEQSLYIGDTWDTDVVGSINAGIPVIWFNPAKKQPTTDIPVGDLYLGEEQSLSAIVARLAGTYNWV